MYVIVRYSFTIIASFCVAVIAGERAFGQMLKGEAAFMTGFALSDSQVWVRPVGVAVSKDGSSIVTEDGHGTIWRVANHETAQDTHNADTGRDLYIANCSACHQASGEGLPGVMPPLKGSGVVNKDDAGKHIQVVLNGMQGARAGGVVYAAVMPPFAGALSDAEISDIINYERRSWGNHGTPVTAAQVAAERARPIRIRGASRCLAIFFDVEIPCTPKHTPVNIERRRPSDFVAADHNQSISPLARMRGSNR